MGWLIHQGDWVEVLRDLPRESVHCVVTSPPYWGLRDYGTARWEGGDSECDHLQPCGQRQDVGRTKQNGFNGPVKAGLAEKPYVGTCGKCGAVRKDGQLGLERTPEEYVAKMVEGFREVRRVLRKDGTLWMNLGDSYVSSPAGNFGSGTKPGDGGAFRAPKPKIDYPALYKTKDLVGIPWMVAFALRADGWYLRSDIIWAKPNPMPESVTDRPTKAHEYLFLMSKSERYYYDQDAIREPWTCDRDDMREKGVRTGLAYLQQGQNGYSNSEKPNKNRVIKPRGWATEQAQGKSEVEYAEIPTSRNKRTVWSISTSPFPEAHFATFPPKLVEPCIMAGCPQDGTVLDPFNGAGTTGLVATRLGRNYIGIELNPEYVQMAKNRIYQDAPLLNGSEMSL